MATEGPTRAELSEEKERMSKYVSTWESTEQRLNALNGFTGIGVRQTWFEPQLLCFAGCVWPWAGHLT